MQKKTMYAVTSVLGLVVVLSTGCTQAPDRLAFSSTLFSGAEQYENFNRIAEIFPVATMEASDSPYEFPDGRAITLPTTFTYENKSVASEDFLAGTDTSAVFVLKDGHVCFEQYWLTGGRDVNWLSMSVAKSFVSAAIGIAIDEGHIKSIEEPISQYVPSLAGSAYGGVRIKDVLQMSSGAKWNEDYSDPTSDINGLAEIMALGGSLDKFTATLTRDREPGAYNLYNSTDTQALGMMLVRATGRSIADYMQEKLWRPLGMESTAYWMVDDQEMEMAFGGLNATARDYAKLGELFRNGGNWQGTQMISSDWVKASVTPDAPHLMPGDNPHSDFPLGYGYQWWVMDGDEGEFSAIGVYNQFIYVNPTRGLVIVKLSANSAYGTTPDESTSRELETIEFFRAIGSQLETAP